MWHIHLAHMALKRARCDADTGSETTQIVHLLSEEEGPADMEKVGPVSRPRVDAFQVAPRRIGKARDDQTMLSWLAQNVADNAAAEAAEAEAEAAAAAAESAKAAAAKAAAAKAAAEADTEIAGEEVETEAGVGKEATITTVSLPEKELVGVIRIICRVVKVGSTPDRPGNVYVKHFGEIKLVVPKCGSVEATVDDIGMQWLGAAMTCSRLPGFTPPHNHTFQDVPSGRLVVEAIVKVAQLACQFPDAMVSVTASVRDSVPWELHATDADASFKTRHGVSTEGLLPGQFEMYAQRKLALKECRERVSRDLKALVFPNRASFVVAAGELGSGLRGDPKHVAELRGTLSTVGVVNIDLFV